MTGHEVRVRLSNYALRYMSKRGFTVADGRSDSGRARGAQNLHDCLPRRIALRQKSRVAVFAADETGVGPSLSRKPPVITVYTYYF